MQPAIANFLAVTATAVAGDYASHVNAVKEARPYETEKISRVALLNEDMVRHYEQAVVLGTTADYEENTKIRHFYNMLDAVDKNCTEDIDLVSCVLEMVCDNAFPHNFNKRLITACAK